MNNLLYVIGIGDDGAEGLLPQSARVIELADVLVGGERQLAFFPNFLGDKVVLKSPIIQKLKDIHATYSGRRIVVLASGDPLFYGIGSLILKQFGASRVHIMPHLSSVQLAFAKAGESWQDANIVSLHGRPIIGLAQKINRHDKVALLTDDTNTPAAIAKYLLDFNMSEYSAFIAENLGGENEQTGWYSLEEVSGREFSALNVMVLIRRKNKIEPDFALGINDTEFSQRKPDRGLITKREIRVLSLSELHLRPNTVMWDIGTCTGSVSIEAVLHTPGLRVYAIEKNEEDLVNLRQNQIKFRTDFVAVHGRAPAGLDEFEDPDAVFIGGSGGELTELLEICAARLRSNGRIVINAATIETLYLAQKTLQNLGFQVSISLVQTARSKPILNLTRFEGMNPVYLVTAKRNDTEEDKSHE